MLPSRTHADVGELLGREPAAEAGEVRRVGAGEPVDRLVGIADHAQVGAVAEPGPQQAELRGAGVLELVDEEVAEAPALRGGELGVALEHVGAAGDEVVEVDEPALALLALVAAEDAGDLGRRARRGAAGGGDGPLVAVGLDQRALAHSISDASSAARSAPSRPAPASSGTRMRTLRSSRPGIGAALLLGPAPQLREGDGVERAGGDRVAHPEPAEAGAQLARGLAGEGDREHVAGIDRAPRATATRCAG